MYFSSQFGIACDDLDDWFDPILNTDTKLFVDPFLIFQDNDASWAGAHGRLISHFNTCFRLIAEGSRKSFSVPYQKALALLRFPEPREFCLGYTESGTRGAGGGPGYARLIAAAMQDAIDRGLQDLRHFEELGVVNEGIGPDRISDLTCNVLRGDFIRYTAAICERHDVPTRQVRVGGASFDTSRLAWRSESVQLPWNPFTGRPILLVPTRFLRELPTLNADDWWENYEAEQLRNDLNYEVMGKVNKKTIVAAARLNPDSVRTWTTEKEAAQATSYDFARDPRGVWQWERAADEYVRGAPLAIPAPNDGTQFVEVVSTVLDAFKHFVEQGGGWKLLWNDDGSEKPEEAAQLLFKGIAQHYCTANNIVLDREVNLGVGLVDFKFSNGYRNRAHIEVKKLHNGRFWNGLVEQLPAYLRSDQCDLGWFLPIQYRSGGTSKRWAVDGPGLVTRLARDKGLRLSARTVDGRPRMSASKKSGNAGHGRS